MPRLSRWKRRISSSINFTRINKSSCVFFYACIKNIQKFRAIRETSMDTAYQIFLEGRIKFILFLFVIFISLYTLCFSCKLSSHVLYNPFNKFSDFANYFTKSKFTSQRHAFRHKNALHSFFPFSSSKRMDYYRCFSSFLANEFIETEIN